MRRPSDAGSRDSGSKLVMSESPRGSAIALSRPPEASREARHLNCKVSWRGMDAVLPYIEEKENDRPKAENPCSTRVFGRSGGGTGTEL